MGEAGRRFRGRGEIVTSCDATTSPRSVTAFRQHLLCRHPIPASLRQLRHAPFWNQFSDDDRSPRDPPPPTDEAWVLRVTLSTLSLYDSGGALPTERSTTELASVAPCLRSTLHENSDFGGSLPSRIAFMKSMAPCLSMHRHGRVGRFYVGPILVLFESLASGLAATSVAPCLRSALRNIG